MMMASTDEAKAGATPTTVFMNQSPSLTIRIVGLGQDFTLVDLDSSTTIRQVKAEVEARTKLPSCYQRLIARGKKLDNDDATLSEIGIENRTRFMLLHNASYATDRQAFETIAALEEEIDELEGKVDSTPPEVLQELATQLCCKLDGVDTNGSESLRALRKKAIEKANAIGHSKDTDK